MNNLISRQEVESPVVFDESLTEFFLELKLDNFIHNWLYLIYIDLDKLDWTVKNYAFQRQNTELSQSFDLLRTKNSPDAEETGPIDYPRVRASRETLVFQSVAYRDGRFLIKTLLTDRVKGKRIEDSVMEFSVSQLRKRLGMRESKPILSKILSYFNG